MNIALLKPYGKAAPEKLQYRGKEGYIM